MVILKYDNMVKLKTNSRMMKTFVVFVMTLTILASCKYDNIEELYPECNTTNVTYSGSIKQIIDNNCYSCHNNNNTSGGISLEGYANVAAASQIPAGSYGSLYGVITWDAGNSPMPKNAAQLDDCSIQKIKAWIDAGSPDN